MKCPSCSTVMIIKTDPKNTDYEYVEGIRKKDMAFDPEEAETQRVQDSEVSKKLAGACVCVHIYISAWVPAFARGSCGVSYPMETRPALLLCLHVWFSHEHLAAVAAVVDSFTPPAVCQRYHRARSLRAVLAATTHEHGKLPHLAELPLVPTAPTNSPSRPPPSLRPSCSAPPHFSGLFSTAGFRFAVDPLYRLEHEQSDKRRAASRKTVLTRLTELADAHGEDDYASNARLRQGMRARKKKEREREEEATVSECTGSAGERLGGGGDAGAAEFVARCCEKSASTRRQQVSRLTLSCSTSTSTSIIAREQACEVVSSIHCT